MIVYRVPATYTAGQLVYAVRHARSNPDAVYQTPDGDRLTAEDYRRWFRLRLNQKINQRGGEPLSRGRKDRPGWFSEAKRLAQKVNTPRLIVREGEVPLEFRGRLVHRISRPEDF